VAARDRRGAGQVAKGRSLCVALDGRRPRSTAHERPRAGQRRHESKLSIVDTGRRHHGRASDGGEAEAAPTLARATAALPQALRLASCVAQSTAAAASRCGKRGLGDVVEAARASAADARRSRAVAQARRRSRVILKPAHSVVTREGGVLWVEWPFRVKRRGDDMVKCEPGAGRPGVARPPMLLRRPSARGRKRQDRLLLAATRRGSAHLQLKASLDARLGDSAVGVRLARVAL
jgi:hypothetical protein